MQVIILSDHSPCILSISDEASQVRRVPFKFFNFWLYNPGFASTLSHAWSQQTWGTPMFQLCSKLKLLKSKLKALNNRGYDDLPARVKEAKSKLKYIQRAILSGQGEPNLTHQEHATSTNYSMTISKSCEIAQVA